MMRSEELGEKKKRELNTGSLKKHDDNADVTEVQGSNFTARFIFYADLRRDFLCRNAIKSMTGLVLLVFYLLFDIVM